MNHSFALAPMSPLIRSLTIALWLLPLFLGVVGLLSHQYALEMVVLFLVILYAGVWLGCRPYQFVVNRHFLEIVFPLWRRRIPMADLVGARLITQTTFRQEFGAAMRIGVGGLWGGFGWLWTSRQGLLEFYISRLDQLVLLEGLTGPKLLITPVHPEQMVATLLEIRS